LFVCASDFSISPFGEVPPLPHGRFPRYLMGGIGGTSERVSPPPPSRGEE